MSTIPTGDSVRATEALLVTATDGQERLAEAARYAVLQRIAPVLRHDVAGFMQPVSMLMMMLQRRVQMPEPDLQVIAKNVASANALTKEATVGCMKAIDWISNRENTNVSLRSSINEGAALLSMELSSQGLEISNIISDDAAAVPQSFFRSVLVGALLAFCDQRTAGRILEISLETDAENDAAVNRVMLRMRPGDAPEVPGLTGLLGMDRAARRIDWSDVEAMAGSFRVSIVRGDGWLAVALPKCS